MPATLPRSGPLLLAGCLSIAALPAMAQPSGHGDAPQAFGPAPDEHITYGYANVLHVAPVYEEVEVSEPVEHCDDYERAVPGRPRNAGATVLGAIIGGVIGNQVGSGNGRRAATVAGAAAGGAIGYQASREADDHVAERRCRLVEQTSLEQRLVGFDVEYRFRDEVFISRLAQHPGDRIRVRIAVTPLEPMAAGAATGVRHGY